MMCDVFTQEAWTCLKAQFVCGRHALDTDMAGTWLLLCLQGVGRIFFFFKFISGMVATWSQNSNIKVEK